MSSPGSKMERRIESDNIDHVYVEFADMNGISRSKQIAADYFLEQWKSGFPMNMLVLVQTARNQVPNNSGYGADIDYADGKVVPDPQTYKKLPWRDDAAKVHCHFRYEEEPVAGVPRTVLKDVVSSINSRFPGLDFYAGSELEFFLLSQEKDTYQPATTDNNECFSWATESLSPFYNKLAEWAPQYGIDLHSLQHEHAAGQLEITFDYGRALEQADTTFDFKRLVKQTAQLTGYNATFMAKPYTEWAGSGYHLHISAYDGDENMFDSENPRSRLSTFGRHFVGGVLKHAKAIAALSTPSPNAFKRYDPDGFAPYAAAWGLDNRMAALRVPSGTPRIENRIPSADANPYIVIAATLAAGADGIERELDPGEPWEGNPAGEAPTLPRSLPMALAELQDDKVMCELLGSEFVNAYTASKRAECKAYKDVVTAWERQQYVDPF